MKKVRLLIAPVIFLISVLTAAGCNSGGNNTPVADTGKANSPEDSMPVMKPPVTDSAAIITTPPVNDNNVIMPDTGKKVSK